MITSIETVEAVQDPSGTPRNRGKFLIGELTFDEGPYGVQVTAKTGRTILVPWANIAFCSLQAAGTMPPEKPLEAPGWPSESIREKLERVMGPTPEGLTGATGTVLGMLPVTAVEPVKRGPGRPKSK